MYSQEVLLLTELNKIIDLAIQKQNDQFYKEASEIVQTEIFDGLFDLVNVCWGSLGGMFG